MGNICQVFVKAPLDRVKAAVENVPAVEKYGDNAVRQYTDEFVVINLINDINSVCNRLHGLDFGDEFVFRDLDAYGPNTYLTWEH